MIQHGDIVTIDGYDTDFTVEFTGRSVVVCVPVDETGYPFPAVYSRAGWDFQVAAGHIA
jgi:hypothetical protein